MFLDTSSSNRVQLNTTVAQNAVTTDGIYPLLLKNTSNSTNEVGSTKFVSDIYVDPDDKTLNTNQLKTYGINLDFTEVDPSGLDVTNVRYRVGMGLGGSLQLTIYDSKQNLTQEIGYVSPFIYSGKKPEVFLNKSSLHISDPVDDDHPTTKSYVDIIETSKLDKLTYEWNKEYNAGETAGYLLVGSFPMYNTNVTIDIDATTTTTYHGTVVIATQDVSETSIGSAHTIDVYGDPAGTISNAIRVVWNSGSRNYNVYFIPEAWSKNLIHIRAIGNYLDNIDETKICSQFTTGTAPTTTSGLIVNNVLTSTFANKTAIPAYGSSSTAISTQSSSAGEAVTVSRSDHTHLIDGGIIASALGFYPSDGSYANWAAEANHATNADNATSAGQASWASGANLAYVDSKNQDLTGYIRELSVSGTTITYTRGDGTSDWITTQDNNTTYSAGTGISLSGTTFSNSGVRSINTGTTNGTISVDTNGTAIDIAVKGLAAAAYKATTTSVSSGNSSLITSGGVYSAFSNKLGRTNNVSSANTNYTTYMARGVALYTSSSTTTPTANGTIAWYYG